MDIKILEAEYLKAKLAYYDGDPIMSDEAFDALEEKLRLAGSKVISQVGSKRKDFDFPHPNSMKSLSKIQTEIGNYREFEFIEWVTKRMEKISNYSTHLLYAPKFDGNAINIIFKDRKLNLILTRGNGKLGKDITDRLKDHVPNTISIDGIVEIRCEAVMPKETFKNKYSDKFTNARNIVAGILGKDDIDSEMISDLKIIPVHLLINGKHNDINIIKKDIDNYTIFSSDFYIDTIQPTSKDYLNAFKKWEEKRESFPFQLDGVVFSFPCEFREILGENEHDPEWAIAIKFTPDEVVTIVEGIEWNLGKTGELTPVVLLKDVQLAGTTVKRASGYNAGYIVKNKIQNGSIVSVCKRGDIIPAIKEVVYTVNVKDENQIKDSLPKNCPICNSSLIFDGIHLYCDNEDCEGKTAKKLGSASAMLDLKGVAGKTLKPFAEDFSNIYELFIWILKNKENANLEKYGIKNNSRSKEIFIDAFLNIKTLDYDQVILMLGFNGVGKKLAQQVAREYCGVSYDYKGFEKSLVNMFHEKDIINYIKNIVSELESHGVIVNKPEDKNDNEMIYICMTGSPKNHGYKTKEEFIAQFSNVQEISLTDKRCQYLVTDDLNSSSSKMKVAKQKNIKIVTYTDFVKQFKNE